MSDVVAAMQTFLSYVGLLTGDEKGEAQVFCDRLFQAFGHAGYKEAGATLEFRVKKGSAKQTSFADLMWKPRMLLEMKRRGIKLQSFYQQVFDYWIHAVPDRPRYVVLCNFDDFVIYDFDKQLNIPVDVVAVTDLPQRYTALNFLFAEDKEPQFGNDLEAVSRDAADKVAALFNSLVKRGTPRDVAQRYVLQLVVALFAEDIDLLPAGTVLGIAEDCMNKGQSSFDLIGGLFKQMNEKTPAPAGRFAKVPYFNGGLFAHVTPVELSKDELFLLGGIGGVAREDWSKVHPAIFGTIFQKSMDAEARHAYGAHFTHEADILRIVTPTIARPWRERIAAATTMKELLELRKELLTFRVLDPACGSGNFLYVSYRELVRIEIELLEKLRTLVSKANFEKNVKALTLVSPSQFFGIDRDSFGVELAKVTLMIGKKLAIDEAIEKLQQDQIELPLSDDALPLDNLDSNFAVADALFSKWPETDAIVGNPPYQSKNKMQKELGAEYVAKLRKAYPSVPGRADYCVFWFRNAHDHLKDGQRAGLVGTNTIRQNYSREGGLDYIVQNGGSITEAVSTMRWSGEADVDVSIVNWIKGEATGKKRLYEHHGADPIKNWSYVDVDEINSALSVQQDVSGAQVLSANAKAEKCFQGQTHGHEGFLLSRADAEKLLMQDPTYSRVLFPFLIGRELVGAKSSQPKRYVIDFRGLSLFEAQQFSAPFQRVQDIVLPARQAAAHEEAERNKPLLKANPAAKVNHHHENFLNRWWRLSWERDDMFAAIAPLKRYIACSRVTLRPIFEFICPQIHPNDAVQVFAFEDDYSFGVLASDVHWHWFVNRCSTMRDGFWRYTSNTVFDTFPWPQAPSAKDVANIAKCAVKVRQIRRVLAVKQGLTLAQIYKLLALPGTSELKDAHADLDAAVRDAYGVAKGVDILTHLLKLNAELAEAEASGKAVQGPGLPKSVADPTPYVSWDCVGMV